MPGPMARGTQSRAPSQHAYKGSVGLTQTETVHVTSARGDLLAVSVHTTIDAVNDPELVERLHADSINTLPVDGQGTIRVDVPVVYHDPAAEVLVLVLGEAQRHRELDERIRLLERLRADRVTVPSYVKDFAVVFGAAGLRSYLEQKAQQVLAARETSKEADRKRSELAAREAELGRAQQELERSQAELLRSQQELERSRVELERNRTELERSQGELDRMRAEARARVIAAVQTNAELTMIGSAPTPDRDDILTKPIGRTPADELESEGPNGANGSNGHARGHASVSFDDSEKTGDDVVAALDGLEPEMERPEFTSGLEMDDEPTGNQQIPAGSDPLTTTTQELAIEPGDKWLDAATKVSTSTFAAKDGAVRLALVAGEHLAKGLAFDLDIRVLLHRVTTYPVITVLVGPPPALRTPSPQQLVVIPLDVAADSDRAVLAALARSFELTADIVTNKHVTRRVKLVAPLAENVAYIMRAADDHLRGITADGETEPSFARARDLVLGAGYDLLGVEHTEASEFRDEKLATLETAQHVRRAIAIARRFARPSREDYLVCARGYPLSRWRELRRQVLERAVAWGIWMGPELAQVAVSEGLARSRRDLVVKLADAFEVLRQNRDINDLDDDAADDNAKALADEARGLGVEPRQRKSNGAIKSEDVPMVSGSISTTTPPGGVARVRTTDELIALLDDKTQRVSAATELCDRADARAAAAVINAVKKMSRAEAVRILGKSVKFGAAAAAPLIEGLQSSKAFLRHGCALALALLRTEEGTHAVIEQLINEPTEIWREIARAIGQIGPTALMPLASHVGRLGERMTPALQERVAWAMAHVGVRGGKSALDQMAAGQSVMAPIARQALGLHSNAARDEVRVRPGQPNKDVTVNRAFSRRFFEALEADRPDVAQAALHDLEASGPAEMLDEDDLIVEDDDEAELDESDLIQT
jgi:hypothetical protein